MEFLLYVDDELMMTQFTTCACPCTLGALLTGVLVTLWSLIWKRANFDYSSEMLFNNSSKMLSKVRVFGQ